jgi:hypothetical protein
MSDKTSKRCYVVCAEDPICMIRRRLEGAVISPGSFSVARATPVKMVMRARMEVK